MKSRKIAIVTGASRLKGIGAAICLELAEAGTDIFFTYYRPYDAEQPWGSKNEEAEKLKSQIAALGVRSSSMELDLTNTESFRVLFNQVEKMLGEPSILINNAAYSAENNFETITSENLDLHYFMNVRAPLMLSSEFAKRFQQGRGGRIIHMTSGQSQGPMPGELAYAATKACIPDMTKTLASEVGNKGITVNAVNPGPTDTGWMTADLKKVLIEKFPMNRIGQPEDAARLVAFLASEAAEWITGQTIHSEGGFLRS
ncbi:SDR family oxidoreductase [Metabacillus hrfriensis]|uniref:SDR family oxidoreductase n=1 Tax=Metabacillus hrfriensis TaxID=3048891 RepID=A0ACD4R5U1_9BACI|nr:SDR family oxidoreductase [Metabacillus sp. CT-WN-B3]UOK56460.1 SDR family oxidoreductase [Bacillus sp. OVS6]USK26607.1 SDR family oxidoreductase [Bacillus sp. CMF21]WHZ55830.1 SDR family oxidoreductase [Metabacillus sp. CT-WN-B3]